MYEQQIFQTSDPNGTLRERGAFGWELVTHSASDVLTHSTTGGYAMEVGGGFIANATTRHHGANLINLQMRRNRNLPQYDELVHLEAVYFQEAPDEGSSGLMSTGISMAALAILYMVALLLVPGFASFVINSRDYDFIFPHDTATRIIWIGIAVCLVGGLAVGLGINKLLGITLSNTEGAKERLAEARRQAWERARAIYRPG